MRSGATRNMTSLAGRLLFLLSLLLSTVASIEPAAAAATPSVTLIPNVGLPSWWNGVCDSTRWNKLAPTYGWKIDASHPGSHPLGASYLGVPVCGPRPGIDGSPDILWTRPGWGEAEWECVELAQRFMAQFYGVSAYGADGGYVVDNYNAALDGGGLLRYYNNGTPGIAPTPGDIISMSTPLNPWGHVVVVAASTVDGNGNGVLTTLSQNDTTDGWRTMNVVNWKVIGFNTFTVKDWLHDPAGRANPLADGTFIRVSGQAQVYRLAGGAPIPATSWTQFGGPHPVTVIAQAQFNRFHTYPTDGTYLKDATTGDSYRVAGGAPLLISAKDAALLPGWGKAQVTAIDHAAIVGSQHLRPYPVDGAVVCNATTSQCFQLVGGAPLYIPTTDRNVITTTGVPTTISSAEFTLYVHLRPAPADGTYFCDVLTKSCYDTAGGAPMPIAAADAAKLPGSAAAAKLLTSHWEFTHYVHLAQYPANGTRICDVTTGNCYVTAGGAPLFVTPAAANRISTTASIKVSGIALTGAAHLRAQPTDGTLIAGAQSGEVFAVAGGVARPVKVTPSIPGAVPVAVDQAAIDNAGLAGVWSHLSSAPSTVALTAPSASFNAGGNLTIRWQRPISSSAVTTYDVRTNTSSYNGGFTGWTMPSAWTGLTLTSVSTRQSQGANTCVQVRAHNRAGQTGPWSPVTCTSAALDDRYPAAVSKGFTRVVNRAAAYQTMSRTTTYWSTWRLTGVTLDRVGVLASTCPTCGTIGVFFNGKFLGNISLYSAQPVLSAIVSLPPFTLRSGTLTLVVTSPNGRLVQLDGVLVSRT